MRSFHILLREIEALLVMMGMLKKINKETKRRGRRRKMMKKRLMPRKERKINQVASLEMFLKLTPYLRW
jgi:hypothetical protein